MFRFHSNLIFFFKIMNQYLLFHANKSKKVFICNVFRYLVRRVLSYIHTCAHIGLLKTNLEVEVKVSLTPVLLTTTYELTLNHYWYLYHHKLQSETLPRHCKQSVYVQPVGMPARRPQPATATFAGAEMSHAWLRWIGTCHRQLLLPPLAVGLPSR